MNIQNVLLSLKGASSGGFSRPSPLLWFVAAALVAPFGLLTLGGRQSNNLPWYFWSSVLALLLLVIIVGFLRFTRTSHEAADISINPGRG